jgi:hypothetical protein
MELSHSQISQLMRRFPEFELSYETISHNKVSTCYDICLAIPTGKKYYAWFTFHNKENVCYLFELNREKKISKARIVPVIFDGSLSLGTVVYGTLWLDNDKQFFIIEDILYFQGISMKSSSFGERLGFLSQLMNKHTQKFGGFEVTDGSKDHIVFALSVMWKVELNEKIWEYPEYIPVNICATIAFPVHHIQYRSTKETMPYLNVNIQRKIHTVSQKPVISRITENAVDYSNRIDLSKPQYKYKTIFQVSADPQYDIYNLFAFGNNNKPVYYNVAYIPSYKTSVFMNSLFRKIRENKNLDYIEESDDEEDFQDMRENKYVDTKKTLVMECAFSNKFKKWIPLRTVDSRTKVVHIFKLVR